MITQFSIPIRYSKSYNLTDPVFCNQFSVTLDFLRPKSYGDNVVCRSFAVTIGDSIEPSIVIYTRHQ